MHTTEDTITGNISGARRAVWGIYCCLLAVFLPLFSCTARISGPLRSDGSADFTISASLEPRMTALVRTLAAASGGEAPAPAGSAGDAAPVLDGPAIARSMSAAPGVVSVSLANTAAAAVEGPLRVSPIGDFLAAGGKGGFISFEQGGEGGRCTIAISRQTGPELLSLLSPEITDYLNALMAPLVTGETLSKPEYLALVSTVYGKAIADEISRSVIRASIEFPGPIRSVRGGAFSGRRANFDIPLPDLLVLETPLRYEAAWNQGSAD